MSSLYHSTHFRRASKPPPCKEMVDLWQKGLVGDEVGASTQQDCLHAPAATGKKNLPTPGHYLLGRQMFQTQTSKQTNRKSRAHIFWFTGEWLKTLKLFVNPQLKSLLYTLFKKNTPTKAQVKLFTEEQAWFEKAGSCHHCFSTSVISFLLSSIPPHAPFGNMAPNIWTQCSNSQLWKTVQPHLWSLPYLYECLFLDYLFYILLQIPTTQKFFPILIVRIRKFNL